MKVCIIGAGTVGLYTGWKLAQKNHKVEIFEKKKEIKNEACSGMFSEKIFKFIPESRSLIEREINYALLHFPKKTIKIKYSQNFYLINHSKLDKLLAKECLKNKVKITLGKEITKLPQNYDRIIGCDGYNSFTRNFLKLPSPKFRLGILGFSNTPWNENYVETWPCKNGFIWKIPRGKNTEYGIMAGITEAKKLLENFLKERKIKISNIQAKIIPQGFIVPKNEKITLLGDATGLTKPWSGGGVIWGLTSADILLKTFPDFILFQKKMENFFLPRLLFSKTATKLAYFFGFNFPWIIPSCVKIESDFLV